MADTLLEKLERTRCGYDKECRWLTFLADAYTGAGGFQGGVEQPPSGYWGPAAELYASVQPYWLSLRQSSGSYLDKHPREDEAKYQARKAVAHYLNYVEPLTDLKTSYLLRKPFIRDGESAAVRSWREDIDGQGTTWDDMRPGVVLRAAIGGWAPVLLDRPEVEEGMSRAQIDALGLDHFIVNPLAPGNLLEWCERGGRLEWAKVRTCRTEVESWDSERQEVEEYTIWTATDATRYTVSKDGSGTKAVTGPVVVPHGFGRVPIAIFRHKRVPNCDSAVFGLPMHAQIALEGRRLFNLVSELDEHVRGQVFAILVMAQNNPSQTGEVQVGVDNGLTLDPQAKNPHYYLAPPASVASTLEARVEATVKEMFRMARAEYTRPVGAPTSGVARAYEFASTNRAIADFGSEIARGESDLAQLVSLGEGEHPDIARKNRVTAPESFDIDDVTSDIKNAMDAVSAKLGPTATIAIKRGLVQRVLPQLSNTTMAKIERELVAQETAPPPAPPPVPGKGAPAPAEEPTEPPDAPGAADA